MRLGPGYLRSRIGRRFFLTLLLAAALPLAVFSALAYGTLADRLQTLSQGRLQESAKFAGLRVYDRLLAAQTALAAMAASSHGVHPPVDMPLASRKLFRAVAAVGHLDGRIEGSHEVADLWAALTQDSRAAADGGHRRLWWQPASDGHDARVLLAVRDAHHWWVGELLPDFLWGDLRDADAAIGTCVTDARGQRLLCPPALWPSNGQATGPERAHTARWSLFTHADFGTVDWVFTRHGPDARLMVGDLPLEQVAWKAALFSLLLVLGLSLVLIRRTLVPLERLIAGARRLARHQWGTRVDVPDGDEFGQLAGAFNEMAGRIARQMQALKVQSGIDREILTGLDVDRVVAQVMARLQDIAPAARVGLLVSPEGVGRWTRVASPHAPAATVSVDPDLLRQVESRGALLQGSQARLAARLLGLADERAGDVVQAVPARAAGRTRALLMLAGALPADEDAGREVLELADRLAVMLVAAERERRLHERAVRDSLTGLLNRAGLIEAIDQRLRRADNAGFVLAFIDLDGFKTVNDSRGHPAGDALLCEVAAALRAQAPADALIARPGGDEFVLLLAPDRVAADTLARALCVRLAEPFVLGGQLLRIGASIGLVRCPEDGRERVQLMRRADLAMYAAKSGGRARHTWFEPGLDERAAERAWLQGALPGAMERDELLLHFQPRIAAGSGRLAAVEALVRWQHPERGLIPPMQFVPLAEETGQVEALGRWVLDAACRQQRLWRDTGLPVPRVAVNVSALQLAAPEFADDVLATLRRHGLQPSDLELEITESLFAGDADEVCSRLQPLRDAGVLVALDDFGTGFSSLSSLHRLPVDVLKIDRSFVDELGVRESADAVARSIVALARALGKHVVAEGVETEAQQAHLLTLGCDELQGYLFARPLPAAALAGWMQPAPLAVER